METSMNKKQAKTLLRLADKVENAKDYDQNDCWKCAGAHLAKLLKAGDCYFDLDDNRLGLPYSEWIKIFDYTRTGGIRSKNGPMKARHIRDVVKKHRPDLFKKKTKAKTKKK